MTAKTETPARTSRLDDILPRRYRRNLDTLMSDYLSVCNQALKGHIDNGFYRRAMRLSRVVFGGEVFTAVVYDTHPDEVLGEFSIRFDGDAHKLEMVDDDAEADAYAWKVPLTYLRDVVIERPTWYINHPLMLDWNWLTRRVGDEVTEPVDGRSFVFGALAGLAGLFASRALIRQASRLRERRIAQHSGVRGAIRKVTRR